MLELRGITKKYSSIPVVNRVSFSVKPYEVLGYLGPNGAGKTTTVKMLAGLIEPTDGEIYFQGKNIKENMYEYKKRIGYVPEQSEIYPHLSAYEYLQLVGRLHQISEKILEEKIRGFMELFQLEYDMHFPISSYSKGMRQKVLISSALLHNPDILLFDEPLSGLDVTTVQILRELIIRLAFEGKIIIYCSHILEIVEKVCSKVIIINKGCIVANDSVENLRTLMELPSLVEIFNQLVPEEDTEKIAKGIVEVMKHKS
ncbi:MAG: ABC transporter ATP-binding protein [Acidobacteriota bacterium]